MRRLYMIDKAVRIGLCEVTDDDRHFVMELETGLELAIIRELIR